VGKQSLARVVDGSEEIPVKFGLGGKGKLLPVLEIQTCPCGL
jgi:hypothetical protein